MLQSCVLTACVFLMGPGPAPAQPWVDTLFAEKSKDFGSVTHGTLLAHSFPVRNSTDQTVHATSLRVSCGCVIAEMEKPELAPGQETTIQVKMNTGRFHGDKTVSIFVGFDQPAAAEAVLQVRAHSCDDVVIQPDVFDFGRVPHGTRANVQVTVKFTGGADWQIRQATCESNHVAIKTEEVETDSDDKAYLVTASLDETLPVGKWYTEVWLHTDHPFMPRIRVPVQVEVEPLLSVTPASMKLETPSPGQTIRHKVMVYGKTPFTILAIKGADAQWDVHDESPGKVQRHILTITLNSSVPGPQERAFQIVTDLPNEGTVRFTAQAVVKQH
jgi:hypothetical protein